MDQRIVLAGLAAGVGLAAGAFLAVSYVKSQAAKAAKIERRKSDTDPVSIYLLLQIVIFDCAFRSRSHI